MNLYDSIYFKDFKVSSFTNIDKISQIKDNLNQIDEIFYNNYSFERSDLLKNEIMKGMKIIDEYLSLSNNLSKNEISFLYYIKTRLFDKLPEYVKAAEESANKSLKMNPFLADSYNCIGHIMWKKSDYDMAVKYFKQALDIDSKNKITLRYLSMIIRSKPVESNDIKQDIAKESVNYAKSAVEVDMKDSESWYVLGNAYFHYAFSCKEQYDYLLKAVSSYNMSEKYQTKFKNPDLYYNRSTVNVYLENYSNAYSDLLVADSIDPTLKAKEKAEGIIENVITVNKLLKSSCNLKQKRLNQIISTIPVNVNKSSGYVLTNCKQVLANEKSNNDKYMISCKIIKVINKITDIPVSFICCDNDGYFFVLSVYNLSKEFREEIKEGLSNAVLLSPVGSIFTFKYQDQVFEYIKINIIDLNSLLINGKKSSYYSSISESSSTFFV